MQTLYFQATVFNSNVATDKVSVKRSDLNLRQEKGSHKSSIIIILEPVIISTNAIHIFGLSLEYTLIPFTYT